MLIIDIFD